MTRQRHSFTVILLVVALLCGGALSLAAPKPAAAAGPWTATGSMAQARYRHTATLLPNGKVLVAGGQGGGSTPFLASAELYDPATASGPPRGA